MKSTPSFSKLKFVLFSFIFISFFLAGLSGCGNFQPDNNNEQGTMRVRLPKISANNVYDFEIVELQKVTNAEKLSGHFARFFKSPTSEGGRLAGTRPRAQFLETKDGIFVPLDDQSMQMASVYYHMQNMATFDEAVGAGSVNQWPRDVAIGAQVFIKDENEMVTNNAIYEGIYDAILLVPYAQSQVPLAVNGGVLAHEHFHSLFFKMVTQKLIASGVLHRDLEVNPQSFSPLWSQRFPELPELRQIKKIFDIKNLFPLKANDRNIQQDLKSLFYLITLLKAFNEGIADLWGWAYTLDEHFIEHSLPQVQRSLQVNSRELGTLSLVTRAEILSRIEVFIKDKNSLGANLSDYAYTVGNRLSKTLVAITQEVSRERNISLREASIFTAKMIVDFLPRLTDLVGKTSVKEELSPESLLVEMLKGLNGFSLKECDWIRPLVERSQDEATVMKCVTVDGKVVLQ